MSNQNEPFSPKSLKQKLKDSFRLRWLHHHHHDHNQQTSSVPTTPHSTPISSPTATSSPKKLSSPKAFKHKCRDLINRIGHSNSHRRSLSHNHNHNHGKSYEISHRRRRSMEFRYDPSNYALNFDKGQEDSEMDEFPNRTFTSRLPQTPSSTSLREITACT
ncbi:hypothetical protein like AT5G35090 [Hibiscus trionum]|uniref:Uncharacterized protein n=1 Tax=Hibiscus trionum TaxID=183268 RepID=A0A9W7ICK2_HIBTR|nr:hypothetical protein like AT5G35090 [Hibiscus trionum]